MFGVITFFVLMLMFKVNEIGSSSISSDDDFFAQFTPILQSLQNGSIIDSIDQTQADILRYHFGLTNEDKFLNATQLITKYGYPVEIYEVKSSDGFVLTLMRIRRSGPPLLLMHGILSSADVYLTSAQDSLAFTLADENYDVWLGNTRGNKYSMKNVKYSPKDKHYWNFTFHEIGIYDVRAFIDFILIKVDSPQLYYVAHSLGTTTVYVLLSQIPEYNDKIALVAAMAPIAWLNHLKSPTLRAVVPFRDEAYFLTNVLGIYDLFSNQKFVEVVKEVMCGTSLTAGLVCSNMVGFAFGFDIAQVNFTNYPVQMVHQPGGGTSTKEVFHLGQEVPSSEEFQQFDYGALKNLMVYGSIRPPVYNVSKITTKMALFYSTNDFLSSEIDVQKLASKLPNVVLNYKVPFPFDHIDFIFGKDAKKLVYNKIVDILKNHPF